MAAPRFTIILPSYNGGQYLKQCVHSVLAQSYTDFSLAVLEDGSADGSLEWLRSLNDSRLQIYPAPHNLGIVDNWARALTIPKGEYMTILGQDDLLDQNYLAIMNALIRKYPAAGLYHAHFRFIDGQDRLLRSCGPLPERETGAQFLEAFLTWRIDVNATGYLMRSEMYDALGGIPRFKNLLYADHALWFIVTQNSYKVTAPEECFSFRLHTSSTSALSHWQMHLEAITELMDFFLRFDSWNREAKQVFDQGAPDFFSRLCENWYASAQVHATKSNRRLEPCVLDGFAEALARITPEKAAKFKNSRSVRLRQFVNSNRAARLAYIGYILARYGRSELPEPATDQRA